MTPASSAATAVPVVLLQGDFLWYALVFFALAILAGIVGMQGIAGMSMQVARIFVIIFLALAIASLLL